MQNFIINYLSNSPNNLRKSNDSDSLTYSDSDDETFNKKRYMVHYNRLLNNLNDKILELESTVKTMKYNDDETMMYKFKLIEKMDYYVNERNIFTNKYKCLIENCEKNTTLLKDFLLLENIINDNDKNE